MTRPRDKVETEKAIRAAIDELKRLNAKISISAVAGMASIKPSTIHKVYPDRAEEIRLLMGRSSRQLREAKQKELDAAKEVVSNLNKKVDALEADLRKLASINYTQSQQLNRLEAMQRGDIVAIDAKRRTRTNECE